VVMICVMGAPPTPKVRRKGLCPFVCFQKGVADFCG
jgi:hypothetical protein